MNYYPFHIGDYASATRHLSWDEDAAYRRLLDVYYTTEKPLPSDLRAVCRRVMATSKAQRDAVSVVLEEFFVLGADGWVNMRAEAEIQSMREKQEAQVAKDTHEQDRMRRYRERRAVMFEALRAVGIVPAWDVPVKDLQGLFDRHCNASGNGDSNAPATDLQRVQAVTVNETATAIPTPTPTPTPVGKGETRVARATPTGKPDSVAGSVWQDFVAIRKAKRAPITDTAMRGIEAEAAKAGISLEEALRTCCRQGWQGFDAGWYERLSANGNGARSPPRRESTEEHNRRAMAEFLGDQADDGRTINA